MDNNEKFKLMTRRYLALFGLVTGLSILGFVIVHSQLYGCGCQELASTAMGGVIGITTAIGLFYFGKKVKEE